MFKNYFKIAFRNIWKNKIYSSINIIGLAIGMAACIIILLFVSYERSFDNFHSKNLYRLNEVQKFEGMGAPQKVALSMFPMGPTMKAEFPEIKNFTRMNRGGLPNAFVYKEKKVFIKDICTVDSAFLHMFNFPVVKGDVNTALNRIDGIVFTEKTAKTIFGDEDPVGKTVVRYGRDTSNFIVTAVLKDVPENSQLQFTGLIPFNIAAHPEWMKNWGGNWLNTYFEMAPNTDIAKLQSKFVDYQKKYMREGAVKSYELFLLPLTDIHGKASDIGLDRFNYQQFDNSYTNIFFIIAMIVLLIACVNFMNLSTARSAERAREVGVRKSVGAFRWQLSLQFIGESVVLSLIAMILSIGLVMLFLPAANHLSQRHLEFPVFTNWRVLLFLIAGAVALGIISGLYPAAYLSSFRPIKVLKGGQTGKNKGTLRNILVVTQFASAIFLIITTVFALRQLNFMKNKDTGFDREQVVTINLGRNDAKYNALKEDLLKNTLIKGVTASQDVLGSHLDQSGIEFTGTNSPKRDLTSTRLIVDHDYVTMFKIPLIAGKNFSSEKTQDGKEYIVNESLAHELLKDNSKAELSSLLGNSFGFDSLGKIVGISKDINFNSLHNKVETMFMFSMTDWGFEYMSVKINAEKTKESLDLIQSVWKKNCGDSPFEYEFLDDHFAEVYRADSQISTIVGALAVLAIIISCLGLFGLASYSAEKRIKEVGIRKVLGASLQNIVLMLSGNFLRYVFIAAVIACPLAWFAVNKWLDDYAYRVDISWWIFVSAVLMAVVIAMITISFQAIRAAIVNPVNSLRTE